MKSFHEFLELEQETAIYHHELNPVAWDGMKLKPEIRTALIKIARAFMGTWGVELEVMDIILTGSNANYNWNKFSDFDLHIIVRLGDDASLVEKLLRAKKDEFNRRHNIRIKGYPVEVYAQNSNEHLVATGQYSLQQDGWLVEPRMTAPSFQHTEIGDMADALIKEAQDAIAANDVSAIQLVLDKISGLRKSGLSTTGEFGLQNMVFKVVRNSGMIEKLRHALVDLSDKDLSLDEALTPQGRFKKQRSIKKYRWKLNRRRKITSKINASSKRFKRRLGKDAVRKIYKMVGVKNKSKLSNTQKSAVERLVKQRAKYYKKAYVRKEVPTTKRTY
jgi:hypothetical protein